MSYFSRRNKHIVEFSGYEEASSSLRKRIEAIIRGYVGYNNSYSIDKWYVEKSDFIYEIRKEFPDGDPFEILVNGEFHKVFTILEIFLDLTGTLHYTSANQIARDVSQAFDLSGSVYSIKKNQVVLRIEERSAKKVEEVKEVLISNKNAYERFFEAVGNFYGRRTKPEDVVKNIYIAAEDYLKQITSSSKFGDAVKELFKRNIINKEQKGVLEKLNEFGSDAKGVRHAGSSPVPTEHQTKWFIETLSDQLVFINTELKHRQ